MAVDCSPIVMLFDVGKLEAEDLKAFSSSELTVTCGPKGEDGFYFFLFVRKSLSVLEEVHL